MNTDSIVMTEPELLLRLRQQGASRLKRVAYRMNRSTLWSLTQNGTVLNVHAAYREAPSNVVDAFARIASAQRRTSGYYDAMKTVREWEGIETAMRRAIEEHLKTSVATRRSRLRCAGTPEQRAHLRREYERLNHSRFEAQLPNEIALRLSDRMRSRLGHIVPRIHDGVRVVEEIALNRKLLRSGNERVCEETLLHEMAHVAAWVFDNDSGHGRAWKEWAFKVGCNPLACATVRLR